MSSETKFEQLTKTEVKLMQILWRANKPLMVKELIELNTDETWEMGGVYVTINRLLKKGAISETGFVRSGKTIARLFAPNYSLQEYLTQLLAPVDDFIDYRKLISLLFDMERQEATA